MSESAPRRRLLPLLGHNGGRSRATCRFRCGDACFHDAPNTSDNPYFGDVLATALSRRSVLRAGAIGAGASAVGLAGFAPAAADPTNGKGNPRLRFDSVSPNTEDAVTVPQDYDHNIVIRWGDPVLPDAPEFDFENQTPEAQRKQFGYNCDYVAFRELDADRGLLWVNHEYTNEALMFAGYTDGNDAEVEQIEVSIAAHGGSLLEVERVPDTGGWRPAGGNRWFNRRVTATTPIEISGPASGDELLHTEDDPDGTSVRGMLNNCAGGMTPWGTILTGEENFHQYFVGGEDAPEEAKEALRRYGIPVTGDTREGNRRFDRAEERFDLSRHPREANRFGYVVEIDPLNPYAPPRKRTMLGRFKHEAANPRITEDGRVAVYMGDDERFEYMYKFVSDKRYKRGAHWHNATLLDSGTLYVARLTGNSPAEEIDGSGQLPEDGEFDGSGSWVPLCDATRSFVDGFTVAEVLVHTRMAADTVNATKMDRPEDFEPNPVTGKVYCALTKNSARSPEQAEEPNPRAQNKYGHILEISERGNDAGAEEFGWTLPIVCGDPEDASSYFAGYDKSRVMPVATPDNLAFDEHGNLWIATDGQPSSLDINDGLHAVPMHGKYRGALKSFATVPLGAECCGPFITPDQKTVFIAPQHPGEGGSVAEPESTWPDGDFPRPSVVSIWHTKGKDVGS